MPFIKLTKGYNKETIYVNANRINTMGIVPVGGHKDYNAWLDIGGETYYVSESVETILHRIEGEK